MKALHPRAAIAIAAIMPVLSSCATAPSEIAQPVSASAVPAASVAPSEPLKVWVYGENDDYRSLRLADAIWVAVGRDDRLTTARSYSQLTLAVAHNATLPERYGPDAFSVQVRVLVNGITSDKFGSICAKPDDPKCVESILRYSLERYEVIRERLRQRYPDLEITPLPTGSEQSRGS
ncbi:MAG: hypothetical protein WBA51_02815 [Erythrobacter sp.]